MKKLLFSLCMLIMCSSVLADEINGFNVKDMDKQAHVGLFMAFSGVDNKYEDEHTIVEIYNEALWITNKSNRTIYLDLAQCFAYYNDEAQSLYVPDKAKKGNAVITETQLITIAPNSTEPLCGLGTTIMGNYSAYKGKDVRIVNEYTEKFMNVVDELRIELESGNKNSAAKHLTEDESFIRLKAAIAYSFDKDSKDAVPVVISSWLSDVILSKYYTLLPPQQEKTKSLSAKKVKPAMVCVAAERPFEYEEEKSPIMLYDININLKKGRFSLEPVVTTEVKTNVFRLIGSVYTMGLISPITKSNKNQFNQKVINWIGTNVDFTKIKDNKEGVVQFGKKGNITTIENVY